MQWVEKKLIFKTDNNFDWMVSHAYMPVVDKIENRLRVYFGTRDVNNRSTTTFIEVNSRNPQDVLYVHNRPILTIGELGCFDDSGVTPSWIVNYKGKKFLYYIGWNTGTTVPYRNSIGLAVSEDNGLTFNRLSAGPILDRNFKEPHFCASSCVLVENGVWRMWYLSSIGWKVHFNKPEPYYHIKYAESKDGIHWKRDGIVCIDFKTQDEGGIARPSVLKDGNTYKMWYSYRAGNNYRADRSKSYRIGYAESSDGLKWIRKDEEVGIDVSETGWDSEMICYPFVMDLKNRRYMFYNGNGFGKSGFGYAVLNEIDGIPG